MQYLCLFFKKKNICKSRSSNTTCGNDILSPGKCRCSFVKVSWLYFCGSISWYFLLFKHSLYLFTHAVLSWQLQFCIKSWNQIGYTLQVCFFQYCVMTNLDSIFKSRGITLPTKVHLVKAMFFPVVMYGCESWTVKKAEHRRIDAFELWCWRKLFRVTWTAKRSNQSILKEICPGISLEGMMLMLKLQYFGHLMWRADSLEKTLMLGGIWDRTRKRRRGG